MASIFYTRRHASVFPVETTEVQTPFDTIDINFDESSQAWRENKQHMGGGVFKYTCSQLLKSGKKCCNKPKNDTDFCRIHTVPLVSIISIVPFVPFVPCKKTINNAKIIPTDK